MARSRALAICDGVAILAVMAWVGGEAALGAFAARIVFRDLPRELAAPTMNSVFRSFDHLLAVMLAIFCVCLLVRTRLIRAPRTLTVGAFLAAIGLFEVLYVHPQIEALFRAGRTLEPWFRSLHGMSEKCGHLSVLGAGAFVFAVLWPSAEVSRRKD